MTSSPSSGVSALPSFLLWQPLAGWWGALSWQSRDLQCDWASDFTVTRVNFDGSFKPLHSDILLFCQSGFIWLSMKLWKHKKTIKVDFKFADYHFKFRGLSSNFLTLKFSLLSREIWEQLTIIGSSHLDSCWLELPAAQIKQYFPRDIITHSSCVLFPRPSQALSSHVVKIPPKCGVTSGSHSSRVYYLK